MHIDLPNLIRSYAQHRGWSVSYASRLLTGNGDTISRLESGGTLTLRRAARIVHTASDNWPADLPWPADIPRPEPAPDSPVVRAEAEVLERDAADPVAAIKAYTDRIVDLMGEDNVDWNQCQRLKERTVKIGLMLKNGRIACPNALCEALGIRRYTYDDVVRRYANGRAGRSRPRKGTDTEQMLIALEMSGDDRFVKNPGRAA